LVGFCHARRLIIGDARGSTDDQNLDAQTDALKAAACERIFADTISGSVRSRPELERLIFRVFISSARLAIFANLCHFNGERRCSWQR